MLYEKDGKMLETIQRFIFQISIVLSNKNATTYFFSIVLRLKSSGKSVR